MRVVVQYIEFKQYRTYIYMLATHIKYFTTFYYNFLKLKMMTKKCLNIEKIFLITGRC